MGTQFAIVYDIIIVAAFVGMIFTGAKKGFASVIIGLAAVFVAFFCAMTFSEPISNAIYKTVVEEPLESAIDEGIDEAMGAATLSGMSHIDYEKVMISGVPVSETKLDYAGTSKVAVELSDMDLSKTGIENVDLSLFGVSPDTDFSSVNGKTAVFTMAEVEQYGLGKLAVAQYLAVSAQDTEFYSTLSEYTEQVGETLPMFIGQIADDITNGSASAMRSIIITMSDTSVSAKEAVINGFVEPYFKMAAQTVLFVVIFLVVSVALSIIASALKIVNKVPVLGSLNSFAGGVVGLLEGLITVFIVCIAVRMIISLSGGNMMFFNDMTINSTFLFKVFYNFEFLNFLT